MTPEPITPSSTPDKANKEIDLLELASTVWTRRRMILKCAIVGGAAGLIIGISTPKQYQTIVKLAPENSSEGAGSSGNMAGLAAMAGINLNAGNSVDGITSVAYPNIIKSTPFLLEFAQIPIILTPKKRGTAGEQMTLFEYIAKHQKRPWWSYIFGFPGQAIGWVRSIGKEREDTLEPPDPANLFHLPRAYKDFASTLSPMLIVETDQKSSIIDITVTMQDATVSALVADSLVTKLQKYMTLYKTQKTRNDLVQSIRQNNDAQVKYYEIEDRLAEAIDQNRTISSETLRVRIERLRNERNLAYNVYDQTAQQVEMARIKLQEDTPIATVVEPAIVPDHASSPRKLTLLVGLAFLAALVAIGVVVARQLLGDNNQNGKRPKPQRVW